MLIADTFSVFEELKKKIKRIYDTDYQVYGVRKVWKQTRGPEARSNRAARPSRPGRGRCRSGYYQPAALIRPEDIDPEVREVLDQVSEVNLAAKAARL